MSDSRRRIGNVEVVGLADASLTFPFTLDQLFPSVTPERWEPYRQRYPQVFGGPNEWHVDFGCYLLRSEGRTILVDSGIGPSTAPMAALLGTSGELPEKLEREGVEPEQVELVVFTHLHPDHVGWNLQYGNGEPKLTFPRARYLAHRADWETFQKPEVQQAFPFPFVNETITPLQALGGLELISGERALTSELTIIHTPGHTPGSQSILINSGGEKAILWGDTVVHPIQVTEPDVGFSFDYDSATITETRRQLLDRVEAEGMTIAACHFPEPGFGRIVRLEGRRYWQGL